MSVLPEVVLQVVEAVRVELGIERVSIAKGRRYGLFIAVEGIDGAGVSSHSQGIKRVFEELLPTGQGSAYTKEPTYGPIGAFLWQMMSGGYLSILKAPLLASLLFAADRAWHLLAEGIQLGMNGDVVEERGVLPLLRKPVIATSDRYKYSTLAYQTQDARLYADGGLKTYPGMPIEWLMRLNEFAPPPHILVFIDVDTGEALRRISGERWKIQLYEAKPMLEATRRRFREVIEWLKREPEAPCSSRDEWRSRLWYRVLESEGIRPEEFYPCSGGVEGYPIIIETNTTGTTITISLRETITKTIRHLNNIGLLDLLTKTS